MTSTKVIFVLFCLAVMETNSSNRTTVKIGGVFDMEGPTLAFQLAVDYVNRNKLLGPSIQLEYVLDKTDVIDSYESMRLVCKQAENGSMAIVGPLSSTSTKAVAPLLQSLNIPQLAPLATNPMLANPFNFPNLVRLMAPDSVQSEALVALVEHYKWTYMAILTSDTDYGINGLVHFQSQAAKRDWRIVSVVQFSVGTKNISATEQLQVIKNTGVRVVILNCLAVFGVAVLEQANKLGMMGDGWAWLVTDGITGGNELVQYNGNIIPDYLNGLLGTRPTLDAGSLFQDYQELVQNNSLSKDSLITPYATFTFDAVLTVVYGIRELLSNQSLQDIPEPDMKCGEEANNAWAFGQELLDNIKNTDGPGVSNNLQLSAKGEPSNPKYDIVNLHSDGWLNVGSWSPVSGLDLSRTANVSFQGGQKEVDAYIGSLRNKTINIVTIVELPFVILKKGRKPKNSSDVQDHEIEGYCIDLLKKLSETFGFSYRLYLVPDASFGIKDPLTRQWNGMVKELVDRRADVAAADLTINYAREQDIDFTKPFMDMGMTFVMKKPEPEKTQAFAFLNPLSTRVWIYILGTMMLVGLYVSFLSKLSPFDHHGEFVYIDQDDQEKINFKEYKKFKRIKTHAISEMNFMNATWFSLASLLQQGGEVYPKSFSARITTVVWWMATVILIATYTANLAAWLTKSRTQTSINSIEDLATQSKIVYGTISSSSVWQFFLDSNVTLFSEMKDYMIAYNTHVRGTTEGINKTREGNFAFIWDSPVLDYIVEQQPCNTIHTVGRIFGMVGYGFGLQKSSPYNDELTMAILQLRESGYMDELRKKWYLENTECAGSAAQESEHEKQIAEAGGQLDIEHMIGVFYIVYGGLILSILVAVIEWLVRCANSVDWMGLDPLKPASVREALTRRAARAWIDFKVDWAPICCRRKHNPSEEAAIPEHIKNQLLALHTKIIATSPSVNNSSTNLLDTKDIKPEGLENKIHAWWASSHSAGTMRTEVSLDSEKVIHDEVTTRSVCSTMNDTSEQKHSDTCKMTEIEANGKVSNGLSSNGDSHHLRSSKEILMAPSPSNRSLKEIEFRTDPQTGAPSEFANKNTARVQSLSGKSLHNGETTQPFGEDRGMALVSDIYETYGSQNQLSMQRVHSTSTLPKQTPELQVAANGNLNGKTCLSEAPSDAVSIEGDDLFGVDVEWSAENDLDDELQIPTPVPSKSPISQYHQFNKTLGNGFKVL